MESAQSAKTSPSANQISQIFSEFMTRVTKFEEFVEVGSRFLVGFQQALEFIRRPTIDITSQLVEHIVKANESRRLSAYIQAGCVNTHDRKQCMNKSESVVKELQCLLDTAAIAVQNSLENLPHLQDKNAYADLDLYTDEILAADVLKPKITDYAALMAAIYGMVKQEYEMQERIVSSLSLRSSSGELESYCLMWSLRPFIDDEIMDRAWKFIP